MKKDYCLAIVAGIAFGIFVLLQLVAGSVGIEHKESINLVAIILMTVIAACFMFAVAVPCAARISRRIARNREIHARRSEFVKRDVRFEIAVILEDEFHCMRFARICARVRKICLLLLSWRPAEKHGRNSRLPRPVISSGISNVNV